MRHSLAILALAVVPAAAIADTYVERTYSSDGRLIESRIDVGTSAIHSGAATLADQALADDVAIALAGDPALDGAILTVAALDGRVSLSGSAKGLDQAYRAEQVARDVAGAGVSAVIDTQGG